MPFGLGNIARYTPQGFLVGGIRNLIQGQPFMAGMFGQPYTWGQQGSASNPAGGQSAFGSSTTPTTYTPNPTAAPSPAPAPGASPLAAPPGEAPYSTEPVVGPAMSPLSDMGGPAAAAAPGAAPGAGVNLNPGAGPRAVDWGQAPKVAQLQGRAQ